MIRIHHLTDSHFARADCRAGEYVEALLRGDLGPPPDLILHTGDLVDGAPAPDAPEAPDLLRQQHAGFHALLARTGIPVRAICHTHDRRGDLPGQWGQTFCATWQQALAQVVSLPGGLDLVLLSGSVSLPPLHADHEAPVWGFDVFDPHVLAALETLVASACRPGSLRVLGCHLPMLLPADFPRPDDRYRLPPIGQEGLERILPVLHRLDFRLVLGGHIHLSGRAHADGIDFIVGSPLVGPHAGFGELIFSDHHLHYTSHRLPQNPPLHP